MMHASTVQYPAPEEANYSDVEDEDTEEREKENGDSNKHVQETAAAMEWTSRRLTKQERQALERLFVQTRYPSTLEKARLAAELSLTSKVVSIWFQNRRAKERRWMRARGAEPPSRLADVSTLLQDHRQMVIPDAAAAERQLKRARYAEEEDASAEDDAGVDAPLGKRRCRRRHAAAGNGSSPPSMMTTAAARDELPVSMPLPVSAPLLPPPPPPPAPLQSFIPVLSGSATPNMLYCPPPPPPPVGAAFTVDSLLVMSPRRLRSKRMFLPALVTMLEANYSAFPGIVLLVDANCKVLYASQAVHAMVTAQGQKLEDLLNVYSLESCMPCWSTVAATLDMMFRGGSVRCALTSEPWRACSTTTGDAHPPTSASQVPCDFVQLSCVGTRISCPEDPTVGAFLIIATLMPVFPGRAPAAVQGGSGFMSSMRMPPPPPPPPAPYASHAQQMAGAAWNHPYQEPSSSLKRC